MPQTPFHQIPRHIPLDPRPLPGRHNAHIPFRLVPLPRRRVRSFNHPGSQICKREEGLLVRCAKRVADGGVMHETAGFDEDELWARLLACGGVGA